MKWRNWLRSSLPFSPRSSSHCSNVRRTRGYASRPAAGIAIACGALSTGCACDRVIAPPGEPRIVTEATGRVRLATFDESSREFVDLGWFDARGLTGWTLSDYDWNADEPQP